MPCQSCLTKEEEADKESEKRRIRRCCVRKTREPESIPPLVIAVSFLSSAKVFQSMFEFLEENWSKLSPGVTKGLRDRPLVPVGARLIKAGRLFFRLKVGIISCLFRLT